MLIETANVPNRARSYRPFLCVVNGHFVCVVTRGDGRQSTVCCLFIGFAVLIAGIT